MGQLGSGLGPDQFDPAPACDALRRLADEAALPSRGPVGPPASFLPSGQHFTQAISNCSGSAGFHGWTSDELRAVEKHLTSLSTKVYNLWCKTTLAALDEHDLHPDLANRLWTWRSQPVSVGSCLKGLASDSVRFVPSPPPAQWCGRADSSVIDAPHFGTLARRSLRGF